MKIVWLNIVSHTLETHRDISRYMHGEETGLYVMGCAPDDINQTRIAQYDVFLVADNFTQGFAAQLCRRIRDLGFTGALIALDPLSADDFYSAGATTVFHGTHWQDLALLIRLAMNPVSP